LEDWRDFRARLIAQEKGGTLVPGQSAGGVEGASGFADGWAYETTLAERGSVLLGGTQSSWGFDLHQQYFHKCVILVLEHDATFTKGLIINRPTSYEVETPEAPGQPWNIWFGGDVQGFNAEEQYQEVNCLHCLPNENKQVDELSFEVVGGLKVLPWSSARKLVHLGLAQPADFWTFQGYCGWGAGQLQRELDRQSWHLAATSAEKVMVRMRERDQEVAQVEDAGVGSWAELMEAIGRQKEAKETEGCLADAMLLEWARVHLPEGSQAKSRDERRQEAAAAEAAAADAAAAADTDTDDVAEAEEAAAATAAPVSSAVAVEGIPDCEQIDALKPSKRKRRLPMGALKGRVLRAGPDPSYILQHQFLHKAIILVIADANEAAIGVVLNRPTSGAVQFKGNPNPDRKPGGGGGGGGDGSSVKLRLCLGGQHQMAQVPVLLFSRLEGLGAKLASKNEAEMLGTSGLFTLGAGAARLAIARGEAEPTDFICVRGVHAWGPGALREELGSGALELVGDPATEVPWADLFGLSASPPLEPDKAGPLGTPARAEVVARARDELAKSTQVWEACSGAPSSSSGGSSEELRLKREELADAALQKFAEHFLIPDEA